jgi:hypothetical protein
MRDRLFSFFRAAQRIACRTAAGIVKPITAAIRRSQPQTLEEWLNSLFQIASAALLITFPIYILFNLNKGLELSDTGYYYNSIEYFSDVVSSITQFGVFWNMLPIPDGIWANRVALWILLTSGGAAAALATWSAFWPQQALTVQEKVMIAAWGSGASCLYYFWWLPDPSYNGLAIGLSLILLAIAMNVARRTERHDTPRNLVAVAGFLIVGLALVRPPTALVVGCVLAAFVLLQRPSPSAIVRIGLAALAGAIGYLIMTSILVEPFPVTLSRLLVAAEYRHEFGYDTASVVSRLRAQWSEYRTVVVENALPILGAGVALGAAGAISKGGPWSVAARLFASLIAVGCTAVILTPLLESLANSNAGTLRDTSEVLLQVYTAAIICVLTRLAINFRCGAVPIILRLLGAVALMTVMLHAQLIGSASSNLLARWIVVGVFAFLLIGLCLMPKDGRFRLSTGAVLAVSTLLTAQWAAALAATQNPYRLGTPLSAQTVRTEIRGGESVLYLDEQSSRLFASLDEARAQLDTLNYQPILIDFSGATPLIAYHLEMRLPGAQWVIGGYDWSQAYLEGLLQELPQLEICRAWILLAPESRRALDPAPLAALNRNLDTDYELITEAYAPYPGALVQLYAPVPRATECLAIRTED